MDKQLTLAQMAAGAGMTLAELADRAGISVSYARTLSAGGHDNPSRPTLRALAYEMDREPDEVLRAIQRAAQRKQGTTQ